MSAATLDDLNTAYGIAGKLIFESGPGGLTVARVVAPDGTATVALHGAHVLSYAPAGSDDLLWLSAASVFAAGEPIRGGIPVCWPWFGGHPSDADKPAHGFARRRDWTVLGATVLPRGDVRLRLQLASDEATRAQWAHDFLLELRVTVGRELHVELAMTNTDSETWTITAALHSYFAVGDAASVRVTGLDGCRYIDTVDGANSEHVQSGDVTVAGEVDRVYVDTRATCEIHQPALGRTVRVAKRGSRSTVVWNPWIAKSARMPDFGDDEYPEMICVETTNALGDTVHVPPGATHTTEAIISLA